MSVQEIPASVRRWRLIWSRALLIPRRFDKVKWKNTVGIVRPDNYYSSILPCAGCAGPVVRSPSRPPKAEIRSLQYALAVDSDLRLSDPVVEVLRE
jgi:hypothetical protein